MPEIKLLVQIKAHSVYEDLLQDSDNAKSFNASFGWFCNFTKRCNFYNIKMRRESALSGTVSVELFVKELQHRIKKREVIRINKFLTSLRLLFCGKGCILGVKSVKTTSAPKFEAMRVKFTLFRL